MLRPNVVCRHQKLVRILAAAAFACLGATASIAKDNGGAENPGSGAIDDDVYVIQRESVCMSGGLCEFVAHCPADSVPQGRLPNGAPFCTPTGPSRTVIP